MIREVFLLLYIISMVTVVIAVESELALNTSGVEDQMLLNTTAGGNISYNSTVINSTYPVNGTITYNENQTRETNTSTSSDTIQNAENTEGKPVYTLSIGSVYSSDYTEPQPRTFSSSGC